MKDIQSIVSISKMKAAKGVVTFIHIICGKLLNYSGCTYKLESVRKIMYKEFKNAVTSIVSVPICLVLQGCSK